MSQVWTGIDGNQALQKFAETKPDCYFVTATGLTVNQDGLHFDAVSQRKFGIRYFESYTKKRSIPSPLAFESEIINFIQARPLTKTERIALLEISFSNVELPLREFEEQLAVLNRD